MRFIWVVSFLLLTACGQKGDLYLPQDSAKPVEQESAPATSANQTRS
ncbi:hypothetical protein RED65_15167 [Oceanobacter sp. RED65]|uniref:Lipoprotein n=2 Tax=Bermanella marisrubri TaxID=207949 RepID=Q1N417_9GAMM|nr:hypothetical protein RED65_15167 [Oceanobacter sp. RED65] [Bermanella marisrubri]